MRSLLPEVGCGACFNNDDAQKLADFIRHLSHNPQEAKNMGSKGRKYLLENCTPQIIAQQYAEIIKD